MTSAALRRARPEDERAFYDICLLTGDSGADASTLYKDPQLLGHVYAVPYLRFAPDFAFVLEDAEGVGGYVIAAPDSQAFEETLEREWWPILRQQYPDPANIPREERTPDQRMINLIHHPNRTHDDLQSEYPAHLHIDLLPRMQGGGNGKRLMYTLLDALEDVGCPGVHLGVGGRNENAVGFYRHLGFQQLQAHPWGYTFGMSLPRRL
ncbi:GNAT family N-acetyltransferase [Deinococcus cavernae]|uniref:GNAT family N-acetyltransferase n=1 Tax=Deinococcus cavernae TaxID=2320857 RepID=A0A418VA09_9DEIO|nr:GNAT family N-acetyltransferase [Deinococcus cavernae]RJF69731.1 GNAT family N-acetyltransferase [Deinococcus cavernae]RJF72909.1 GNAT family N-acetyltransferase [Deinococcus cavernae]